MLELERNRPGMASPFSDFFALAPPSLAAAGQGVTALA